VGGGGGGWGGGVEGGGGGGGRGEGGGGGGGGGERGADEDKPPTKFLWSSCCIVLQCVAVWCNVLQKEQTDAHQQGSYGIRGVVCCSVVQKERTNTHTANKVLMEFIFEKVVDFDVLFRGHEQKLLRGMKHNLYIHI